MANSSIPSARKKASSKRSNPRAQSLRSGRPPLSTGTTKSLVAKSSSISSKHTRALINTHHLLQKRLATARSENDVPKIQALEAQLSAQGGLKSYQVASRTGQSAERGGDSSQVLVKWLDAEISARKGTVRSRARKSSSDGKEPASRLASIRILEVGALSTQNALNIPDVTSVRRIDLHSSEEGIEEIDFMDLPIPEAITADEPDGSEEANRGFDVLSLSLVLNYVPDIKARGDMLRRTTLFFRSVSQSEQDGLTEQESCGADKPCTLPCLFLVLPAPCLDNSRYLNAELLTSILQSLGYTHLHTKTTQKLHYSLWRYDGSKAIDAWVHVGGQTTFKKREIRPGGARNNFCIVLE